MIWPDWVIQQRFDEIIPISYERDYRLINPASFDVRIGYDLLVEENGEWVGPITMEKGAYFDLHPGQVILVSMLERVRVPLDCTMEFKLKSSRAREGFQHALAGWVDPGWDGYLTMELSNTLQSSSLRITPGLRIGQMVCLQMLSRPQYQYSGRYNGADTVEKSKYQFEDVII